ncbi:heavy-metal-associated domain-containing protein [Leucobacter soli]|uniref:HMA domain-containing protein n=1 Tax=Leucobacter soli TaxID=2812850 RepID=A0A916JWH8_9MICO|nr:heavy metal-associated domain-containing protein [Leucobacter soli]CAG7605873.1 hypothetical protein LEUCIP111803_00864 [Leucobacter soli]
MGTIEYTVTGMTCTSCERHVRDEIGRIAGVTGVKVDHRTGRLAVTADAASGAADVNAVDFDAAVLAAVDEAGYSAARS